MFATVYFVSVETGADINPGTELLPWLTIEKATTVLVAGDTVQVKAGEYEVSGTNTRFIPALNPANSGTLENPIVFKTYCDNNVVLVQNDFGGPLIGSYERDYIVWDGFIVKEATTYEGFPETEHTVCVIWSSTGVRIQNCEVIGELNSITTDNHIGIRVENSIDPIIRNCSIHGVQNSSGTGHGYGVENFSAGTTVVENLIVENCEIYNCGVGIGNHEGGVNNIYRKNNIHNCSDRGIGFGTQNGSSTVGGKIYQNLIVAIGDQSIYLTPPSDTEMVGFEIFNNTIFTFTGTDVGEISTSFTPDVSIWNNIIVQAGSHPRLITERYVSTSNIDFLDYNRYDTDGEFVLGLYSSSPIVYSNLLEWATNTGHDVNSFIADPLFTNPATNNFHLQDESPCIAAGIDRQDYNDNGNFTESINLGAYINMTDTIGTYDVPNLDCFGTLSSVNLAVKSITIYPNPTTGIIRISDVSNGFVSVMDVYGKVVKQHALSEGANLDISEFSQGIYFISVTVEGGIIVKKIIKRR